MNLMGIGVFTEGSFSDVEARCIASRTTQDIKQLYDVRARHRDAMHRVSTAVYKKQTATRITSSCGLFLLKLVN